MDEEKPIKVEILYGFNSVRPEPIANLDMGPPLKWYEAAYYAALAFWSDVVWPSFLFALAFVAFKFAVLGHF